MSGFGANSRRGWLVTLSASSFFFYIFIQLNLFNAINVPLMRDFGLGAAGLGQLGSMFFYANALCLFPAGILLDRFSTRRLLLWASIIATIGTFIFARASHFLPAALGRFMVGVGASFCFLSCIRIASRWFPPEKMAFVTGIVITMAMLGGLVAQTPLTMLASWVGWRQAVLLDGCLGVVITLVIFLFVADRPPGSQAAAEADKQHLQALGFWRGLFQVLGNPQNWLGGLYTSLMNLPVFLLGALWGIHYLVQVHHIPPVQASYATTLFFVGIIFGSPVFGWFSDHIGRRVLPMLIGAVVSLSVMLVLMCVPNLSLSALILLFFLIGFVTSSQVLSYPLIAELNPPALTSTAVSVDSVTIMLSGAIFQPLFGWVMSMHADGTVNAMGSSVYAPTDFIHAMWIMPVAFMLSIGLTWFMQESFCRAQGVK